MDISKYIHEFDYKDEEGYVHFKGLRGRVKSFIADGDKLIDMDTCSDEERTEMRKKVTLKCMQGLADVLARDSGCQVKVIAEKWDVP